ncbi:methylaspartate mutase [bacterium]|nr:methylaspartate mutase [bacterium]
MTAPAIVTLECLRPAAFLGGQAMRVLSPLVHLASEGGDWDRLAQIFEVRGSVERLLAHLEGRPVALAQPEPTETVPDAAYVVIDCGSTTTKAVLIKHCDGRYRLGGRAEAPTTVEAPTEDVMVGVDTALRLLQEQTGHAILDHDGRIERATGPDRGVGHLLATSSAGGGLQMVVLGLVRTMTAASAERAALGAGAILADVVAWNDAGTPTERIERLRESRPDMVLLAGGTDGGAIDQVVALAEQLAAAELNPRWGRGRLPVVYAGNADAAEAVLEVLDPVAEAVVAPNLRPDLETENLGPVRRVLHDVFLRHVMVRAPGYPRLQELCRSRVLPTPVGFGEALELLAAEHGEAVAIDLGGATCDVFSVRGGEVYRSVSANLGLSFSLGAVCERAGWVRVGRWLPMAVTEDELRDRVRNKMIRPTTLPQTPEDLLLEQAAAREAVRLAIVDHAEALQPLHGRGDGPRGIEALRVTEVPETGIDWAAVDLILGSGGPLAHAPRRRQAAAILIDACRPQGVTRLAVDSVFIMPHLGALGRLDTEAAAQVLASDAVVVLGTVVGPVAGREPGPGDPLATIRLHGGAAPRSDREVALTGGELTSLPLPDGEADLEIVPAPGWDFGAGPDRAVRTVVAGGPAGVILDGRGPRLPWPAAELARRELVHQWLTTLDALPGRDLA